MALLASGAIVADQINRLHDRSLAQTAWVVGHQHTAWVYIEIMGASQKSREEKVDNTVGSMPCCEGSRSAARLCGVRSLKACQQLLTS